VRFPTVQELAKDTGRIGMCLRRSGIPDWVLKEADRWDDPWKFLAELPVIRTPASRTYRRLFAAAQSQRQAMRRLVEIAYGAASIRTGWREKMMQASKAGNRKEQAHAKGKLLAGMWRLERGRRELSEKTPAWFWAEVRTWGAAFDDKAARKIGGRTARQTRQEPTLEDLQCNRVAYQLVCGWLQGGRKGCPGFCFCSDSAICELLRDLLKRPKLQLDEVRKARQRLKLVQAEIFFVVHEGGPEVVRKG
jgi:hypothetical protein